MKPKSVFSLIIVILLHLIAGTSAVLSIDELPVWEIGSWWDYTTVNNIHLQETGSDEYADIVLTDIATRYKLTEIEPCKLSKGSALTYTAYVVPFTGTLNAEGVYHIVDPFPMDVPIQIRNATLTGEWWVDTLTLGTIYFYRHIEGPLWADIWPGGWKQIGWGVFNIAEEYEPPRDEINFPIDVGNTWTVNLNFFSYGDYVLDYDIGNGPEHVEDTFDAAETYEFDMTVLRKEDSHGFDTYRIEGDETSSDGALKANYSPTIRNMTYERAENLGSAGSSVKINSSTRNIVNYFLASSPAFDRGIQIETNKPIYHENDQFLLTTTIVNDGPAVNVDEYILLDVYENYWFWPDWKTEPDSENRDLALNGSYPGEIIMEFTWPAVEGSANGLNFWAALIDPLTGDLFGEFGVTEWGYTN